MLRWGMRLVGLAGALALAVTVAAQAQAATFCVQKPACVNQGGTSVPTLGSAIASAGGNGGGRDRIEVGPGTFTDGPFNAVDGNPVNIVGSGARRTTLTRLGTTDNVTILALADSASRASDLRVLINEGSLVRGIQTAGALQRIRLNTQNIEPSQVGIGLNPGGSVERGFVGFPIVSTGAVGVSAIGPAVIRNTRIRAPLGLFGFAPSGAVRATRLRISAHGVGVSSSGGNLVLDQATVALAAEGATALNVSPTSGTATMTARHVTAVGSSGLGSTGFRASALGVAGPCPTANAILRNSILRNFNFHLSRSATNIGCTGTPMASINVAWSVFDPGLVTESGSGSITTGRGNRNVNPRFVDQAAGDFHLKRRSPLIDRGQRGRPKPGESKRDLDGRKRVLDGDGNGRARRDVGAFERKRRR